MRVDLDELRDRLGNEQSCGNLERFLAIQSNLTRRSDARRDKKRPWRNLQIVSDCSPSATVRQIGQIA
jgi:hypothetical protein